MKPIFRPMLFVIGLAICGSAAELRGQEACPCKPDAAAAPDAEVDAAPKSQTVCPMYPYLDHGTYVSYYAIVRNASSPFCGSPLNYDGPSGLNGNCNSGAGCVAAKVAKVAGKNHQRPHLTHPTTKQGIDAPTAHVRLPGAYEIGTGIETVEFSKNPNGGAKLLAKIFLLKLRPSEFSGEPSPVQTEIEVGVGYQVGTGTPQRSVDDDEVITRSRDQRQVTILVEIRENEWREFNIILLKTTPSN